MLQFIQSLRFLFAARANKRPIESDPPVSAPFTEPEHPAGQLWLRSAPRPAQTTPAPFRLAVDCYPSRTQGALNDNKLVLGPTGSGRSSLLARLTETCHAAGNQIVALTSTRGPIAAVGERVGSQGYTIAEPAQASFNPFWFPEPVDHANPLPSNRQLLALATLLESVLQLTACSFPTAGPPNSVLPLRRLLVKELERYYSQQPWLQRQGGPYARADNAAQAWHPLEGPAFNSFYEFSLLRSGEAWGLSDMVPSQMLPDNWVPGSGQQPFTSEEKWFLQWLTRAGSPFYAGGKLDLLLNATPQQVGRLVESSSRFLRVSVNINESFKASVDRKDFAPGYWGCPAPEALQRVLLLLLHRFDTHLTSQERRLTIVLDELHYAGLGPLVLSYLSVYLKDWKHYNRDIIAGWHEYPDTVFSCRQPAAQLILAECDCQVLPANRLNAGNGEVREHKVLQFSKATQALFLSLCDNKREVLIRVPANATGEVFQANLTTAEAAKYLTAAEVAMRAAKV